MGSPSLRVSLQDRVKHAARRQAARFSGSDRELPSYFIVGTKRGGTTSLSAYLHQHPNVMQPLVEKGCRYFDVNYDRGWEWFLQNMPPARDADRSEAETGVRPLVGESSPYYSFLPEAPQRIADAIPDARLLFIVRDPVIRAWSHFNYETSLGYESLPIHDALDAEPDRLANPNPEERATAHRHQAYLARGHYADQITHMHESFPEEQLLVVRSESLFEEPEATMDEVHRFLGIPSHDGDYRTVKKANSYEAIPDDVRERLANYYRVPNARLYDLVDRDMGWL